MGNDLIDNLIEDWVRERPDFDPGAMAVVGRIIVLAQRYEADANAALADFNLKYTEFDILATLRRSGVPYRLTPTELCAAVLLTSGAMTAALDRLEKMRMITRVPDRNDRRVKAAELTPMGVSVAEKSAKTRFELARHALSVLSRSDQKKLAEYLRKL